MERGPIQQRYHCTEDLSQSSESPGATRSSEGFKISLSVAPALDQTQKREREKELRRKIAPQLFGDKGLGFSAPVGSPLLDGTDSF